MASYNSSNFLNSSFMLCKIVTVQARFQCFGLLGFVRITDEAHEFRNKYWDVEIIQEKLQNEYGDIIGGDQTRLMVIPPRFQHTKDAQLDLKSVIWNMEFQKIGKIEMSGCRSFYGIVEHYLFPKVDEYKWMQFTNNI